MEEKELLEYMKNAIEVETDLATQEQIVEICCADIQRRKPTLQLMEYPTPPELEVADTHRGYSTTGGIFLIVLGILVFLFLMGFTGGEDGGWIFSLLMGGGCALVGVWIMSVVNGIEKRNEERLNAHYERVNKIRRTNDEKQKQYDSAVRECTYSQRVIREEAQPNIEATRALLEKLYDKGIIYRKYCTLPALTSIYEYFITGRCTELTGPHGAYNMYEDELRKDTVISQLNTVIENLEQIRNNQYMLYQQVKAIQENTSAIVSELRQIKGYTIAITELTALNAYYAALNERNTRITMYYHL